MKILFDQGVPAPLRGYLPAHAIATVFEIGWSQLLNGELLNSAERDQYEVFVTTDRNLKYQQNLAGRRIAIVVLLSTSWPRIRAKVSKIQDVISKLNPADYVEVPI